MSEINYSEVAELLECSPRQARRVLKIPGAPKAIRKGHRTVRFKLDDVLKFKRLRDRGAFYQAKKFVIQVPVSKKNGGAR